MASAKLCNDIVVSPTKHDYRSSPVKSAKGSPVKSPRPAGQTTLQDDDLALARLLQEQERAFFLLANGYQFGEEEYSDREADSDEGALPQQQAALAGQAGAAGAATEQEEGKEALDDEELARRLQQQEDMETWRQLYAAQGLDPEHLEQPVEGANMDGLGYEDLQLLGEVAGTVSKGLAEEKIQALPTASFAARRAAGQASLDKCLVCQLEFEDEDQVKLLPCDHYYHPECISQWLGINKVCPMCSKEVA